MSSTEMFGDGPAGDEAPEEYHADDQSATRSPDTGTTYDRTGEAERTPHDEVLAEEAGDAANPNAESSAGLAGDLGVSSERTGPADETSTQGLGDLDHFEGAGTVGTARSRTHGTTPTTGGPDLPTSDESQNPAEVPPHEPSGTNPGHGR